MLGAGVRDDDGAVADRSELYPELAAKYKVPLVPFIMQNVLLNGQEMLQPDFHPNARGAAEIAATIWPYLQQLVTAPTTIVVTR